MQRGFCNTLVYFESEIVTEAEEETGQYRCDYGWVGGCSYLCLLVRLF